MAGIIDAVRTAFGAGAQEEGDFDEGIDDNGNVIRVVRKPRPTPGNEGGAADAGNDPPAHTKAILKARRWLLQKSLEVEDSMGPYEVPSLNSGRPERSGLVLKVRVDAGMPSPVASNARSATFLWLRVEPQDNFNDEFSAEVMEETVSIEMAVGARWELINAPLWPCKWDALSEVYGQQSQLELADLKALEEEEQVRVNAVRETNRVASQGGLSRQQLSADSPTIRLDSRADEFRVQRSEYGEDGRYRNERDFPSRRARFHRLSQWRVGVVLQWSGFRLELSKPNGRFAVDVFPEAMTKSSRKR
jgi:hypothetical protein